MARGRRTSLASLGDHVGDGSPVDSVSLVPHDGVLRTDVPLADLVANPRNPRDELGDLSDLESIVDRQLQPGTAVSRAAWLGLYPEDETRLGTAKFVVVNGCRRLAASRKFGRPGLDVVVRDAIASSRSDVVSAAVLENIARRDFDVIEEAKAVDLLAAECGSADAAAARLGRTKGWVSQRRALLKLAPELQAKLRAGELAVRVARSLSQVPFEEQVEAWRSTQNREPIDPSREDVPPSDASDKAGEGSSDSRPRNRATPDKVERMLKRIQVEPSALAEAARAIFSESELLELISALGLPR